MSGAKNKAKFVKLILALQEGGMRNDELAKISGFGVTAVREWTNWLHSQRPKYIHISAWDLIPHNNAPRIAVWSWGNERDAARPPKVHHSETARRTRERKTMKALQEAFQPQASAPIWENEWG